MPLIGCPSNPVGRAQTRPWSRYLVRFGTDWATRGGVYDGADRRQIPMGMTELAKAEFAGVNADADP